MAKRKTLKCPKCDRKFSMAAHVARHLTTIHSTNPREKRSKMVGRSKAASSRQGRTSRVLASFSTGSTARLLTQMGAYRSELVAERDSIGNRIHALETAIDAMQVILQGRTGASGNASHRATVQRKRVAKRAQRRSHKIPRAGSLSDRILKVLRRRSKPSSPADLCRAVKASGYKSKSKNLNQSIHNALSGLKGVKRVGRGLYKI